MRSSVLRRLEGGAEEEEEEEEEEEAVESAESGAGLDSVASSLVDATDSSCEETVEAKLVLSSALSVVEEEVEAGSSLAGVCGGEAMG